MRSAVRRCAAATTALAACAPSTLAALRFAAGTSSASSSAGAFTDFMNSAPPGVPPRGAAGPESLQGDAAYAEAMRLKFEAQKEALEQRLKQEQDAADKLLKGKLHSDKTLGLISSLANVHRDFGRYEDELRHLKDLREAAIDLKGREHAATIFATTRIATCLGNLNRFEERLAVLEGVRPLVAKVYTTRADIPQACAVLAQLADAYHAVERYDEQVDCLTKIVEAQDEALGVESADVAVSVAKLAEAYGNLADNPKRHQYQIQLLENRLPPLVTALGPNHPHVFALWMHLALAYGHEGRRADQLGIYDALMQRLESVFGADIHPMALVMRRNRAAALISVAVNPPKGARPAPKREPAAPAAAPNDAGKGTEKSPSNEDDDDSEAVAPQLVFDPSVADDGTVLLPELSDVLADLSDVVDSMNVVLGQRDPDTFIALHLLADGYGYARRWRDAVAAFDELVGRMEAEGGGAGGLTDVRRQREAARRFLAAEKQQAKNAQAQAPPAESAASAAASS